MATDQRVKQLKIKTNVVKRITKEKQMYQKESILLSSKVEKMKADGKDEYDIKKQVEVYEESRAMIPDTKRRLDTSINDLEDLMNCEHDLIDTQEGKAATITLEAAKTELNE